MNNDLEILACKPCPVDHNGFNAETKLPYGCTVDHIFSAMNDFIEFLGFINQQLHTKKMPRLETILMAANFSSIVGEFTNMSIPKYCQGLVKNQYHNGYPDLLPSNLFPDNSAQHSSEGIEIKASRYESGWQGHNPEDGWFMVFMFSCNNPDDTIRGNEPKPFKFTKVVCAYLTREDWSFSGRSDTSRRTITTSIIKSGYAKMAANWVYKTLDL
jgi:hypothetical protein